MEVVLYIHASQKCCILYPGPCVLMNLFRAGLGVVTSLAIWALSSRETPVDQHGKIDVVGSALVVSSLVLFNFVWKWVRLLFYTHAIMA
jgi:hypothetical protein